MNETVSHNPVSEIIDPGSFNVVTKSDIHHYLQSHLLQVPAGPVADCLSSIKRFKSESWNHPSQVINDLLRLYRVYTRFQHEKDQQSKYTGQYDLCNIEREGEFVSFAVTQFELRNRIRAEAKVLIERRRLDQSQQFQYAVMRYSIGPRFGQDKQRLLVLNPTLASARSILTTLEWLKEQGIVIGPDQIRVWSVVAAPLGIKTLCEMGIQVVTAEIAHGLNEQGYIVDQDQREWIGNMANYIGDSFGEKKIR